MLITLDFRCEDAEKIKVVRVVAGNIVKLSTRLIDCANTVAAECQGGNAEPSQRNVENVELLRRDWGAQVSGHRTCNHAVASN